MTELQSRMSWTEYFSSISILVSKRSSCSRLNVGCVLVKDNRILSTGYNGHIPGFPHESIVVDNSEQLTIHAELNAILDAASRGVSVKNCDAYITHFPCLNCLKSLLTIGCKNVFYLSDYKNNELCLKLLEKSETKLIKIS